MVRVLIVHCAVEKGHYCGVRLFQYGDVFLKEYLILDFVITDLPAFMEYVEKIPIYLSKHAGHYLVEGVTPEILEGDWEPKTIVVLEFETQENANNFLSDPEVRQLFTVRHKNTKSNLIKVSGGSWRDELPQNSLK